MKFLATALLLFCWIFEQGIWGQEPATQKTPQDHLLRGDDLAGKGDYRGAVAEFRAAIRLDQSYANAHWHLASALDHQDNPPGALKEYEAALKLDPKLRDDKTETAERHAVRADQYLGANFGHWYAYPCGDITDNWVNHCMDDAAAEYRIALLLDPGYVPAHVGLGVVLAKFHRVDAAIEEFRAALHLDPQSPPAHLGLGKALEKKGKLNEALVEYRGALWLDEGRAKYEKLLAKLGVNKQGRQLGGENNAEDHQPAGRLSSPTSAQSDGSSQQSQAPQTPVVAKSLEPAPESKASTPEKPALHKNAAPEEILREFKSYYTKSDTLYLHRETLLKELEKRGEFSAWGLTPAEDSKAADVVIVITLPFLTWEWNYQMVYQPTGAELGKGKVSAAVEKTAAPQLAAMIVKRIGEARPLPTAFQETETANQPQANSATETGQSWKVKYLSGSITGIPRNSSVTLKVNPEWITFHVSKTVSFSVQTPKVTTVVSSTQVRKASKGWDEFWDTAFDTVAGGDGGGVVLVIPTIPIALLGEGVLAPMKVTQHFVSIYWLEDGAMKSAEFSAGLGEGKLLLAELNKATGKNVVNIQESIKRKKEWIANEYYRSPIIKIEKKVSIGWGDLAPGEYRIMFDPAGPGIAEVYFYPAKRSSFDVDLVTQGVAQYESGITNLIPSVTYREQNGVTMLDQIETNRVILRFTPIPLGFAN